MKLFANIIVGGSLAVVVSALQACTAGNNSLPNLAETGDVITNAIAPSAVVIDGAPVDVYTRIAKGANGCWFNDGIALLKGYSFHSAMASDRSGAIISIHQKGPGLGARGPKALDVQLTARGSTKTSLSVQNLSFPPQVAESLTKDVERWAKGENGCDTKIALAGSNTQEKDVAKAPGRAIPLPSKAPNDTPVERRKVPVAAPVAKPAAKPVRPAAIVPAPIFRGSTQ